MKSIITKTTLQRKFAGLVLYNSILAAILLVLLFGFWRYFQLVDNHQQQLENLSAEHLTGIENSLWLMDNLQTRRQLNELRLILDLDYAEIIHEGKKLAAVGSSVDQPLLTRSLEISRVEDNKIYSLGTLKVYVDSHSITSKLADEVLPLLAITLLVIIIPGILMNASMKKVVTNRLQNIVNLLNQPGDEKNFQKNIATLKSSMEPDEIDRLTEEISEFHRLNTTLNLNLQQQQNQLKIIFENTGILFGLLDNKGKIVNINKAALDLNANSIEDLIGTYFWDKLWNPWVLTNSHQTEEMTQAAIKGSVVREEVSFSSEKGKYYLDFFMTPIKNGEDVEYILVEAHDVTQLKRWEVQQQTQVKLLKYFLSEDSAAAITDKIVEDIHLLLPPGVSLHIFQENSKRTSFDLIAGGLYNSTENISFKEIVSSLLKSDFSLKGPTTISFDNDSLQLTPEIINLTELLSFNRLYIEPITTQNNLHTQESYSIITIDKGIRISSFVTQLCTLCSSLAGMALQREKQQKITKEVEDNMGEVVNSSLDGILVLDQKGKIRTSNRAFALLLGIERQDIVGKNFWDLNVSLSQSETKALINSTQVSGKQKYQITIQQNGMPRHCEVTLVTIGDKNPQFYAFFQDRTEQQLLINKLEDQYQFIRAVFNNTSDAIFACDAQGKITLHNSIVGKLLNLEESEIIEKIDDLYQLYEEDGITKIDPDDYPLMRSLREGFVKDAFVIAKSKDGREMHFICNGSRLISTSGETIGAVVSSRDITSEKKARYELEQYQLNLEGTVAERTKDLQLANDELEAFAYSVSHDLRAPLRSISGFAEILNEDYSGLISKSGQDLLSRIMKNATYLGSLIENLLMLSKISRATMETGNVDISSISEELLKEEKQSNPNLNYKVEKDLMVQGDSGLIKILMKNLISNAVKYSAKSENPMIQFSASTDSNKSEFILEDNGVGFNSKYSDKIFKPFQRVHGDEYEGTGIGLSIVQRIIARHQGEIQITSEIDQGTLVKFKL